MPLKAPLARVGVLRYAPPHEQAPARQWCVQAGCLEIVVVTAPLMRMGGVAQPRCGGGAL